MKIYDVAVIGAGPAGMTAAIYACRAGKSVALFEKNFPGGQMVNAHIIDNYPAEDGISGFDLAQKMFEQVTAAGADFINEEVTAITSRGDVTLTTASGSYRAKTAVLATGTERLRLGIPGEDRLDGRGVSWCATCDGAFYRGKDVAVIGGGNSAVSEALYLSAICKSVHIIHRRDSYRAEASLAEKLRATKNITEHLECVPVEITGEDKVSGVILDKKGEKFTLAVDGVFVAIGGRPEQKLIAGVEKDGAGYIKTDNEMRTSLPRVFAAGDNISKQVRQIVTACSDGAIAALSAASSD